MTRFLPKSKVVVVVVVTLLAGSLGWRTWEARGERRVLGVAIAGEKEKMKLNELKTYWEKVASDSPTFRDAWAQLSVISYRQANDEEAKKYLDKALEVDPNWQVPALLSALLGE